ncbi:MAG TPA: hypothetical protein DEH22_14855 [Chloroflexi bacterium]|nr:hypothetical protein [Chloroflexota bacterium]
MTAFAGIDGAGVMSLAVAAFAGNQGMLSGEGEEIMFQAILRKRNHLGVDGGARPRGQGVLRGRGIPQAKPRSNFGNKIPSNICRGSIGLLREIAA